MEKNTLASLQKTMMGYLIKGETIIEQSIVKQGNVSNKTRLNIYKNAYQARLKEVIDNDHPILGIYLGDDLFDEMVSGYIQDSPSNYTSLRHYANQLPLFLANKPPFSQHPIISEIAQFERLLLDAFDAEDASRYSRKDLQNLSPTDWPELTFRFHPSVQLTSFEWNSVKSWQALKKETSPDPATQKRNHWLLWRNAERLTQFRSLIDEEVILIHMILAGENFSALCDFLLDASEHDDVSMLALNYISAWLDDGILRNFPSVETP